MSWGHPTIAIVILRERSDRGIALAPRRFNCLAWRAIPRRFAPQDDALGRDDVLGQDDLVAVMTPEMAATDITFARKTTTIDGFLTRYWAWGERSRALPADPVDAAYGACYPNQEQGSRCADQNGIAAEMTDRRHEKLVLDVVDFIRASSERAICMPRNGHGPASRRSSRSAVPRRRPERRSPRTPRSSPGSGM